MVEPRYYGRDSSLPLDWPGLCRHVRRGRYPDWRGEMPVAPGGTPVSAPLAIAVCAQFGQRHAFASEAEAETFRGVGPRAVNVVGRWRDLAYDREAVRLGLDAVRHWRTAGDRRQAELAGAELRRRWTMYRRGMRRLANRIEAVRAALAPRAGTSALAPRVAA